MLIGRESAIFEMCAVAAEMFVARGGGGAGISLPAPYTERRGANKDAYARPGRAASCCAG
jgi:hypothetical protein